GGSKSLTIPNVPRNWLWTPQQVASLAGQGSIYIVADKELKLPVNNIISCMGNWDEETIDADVPLANDSFKKQALDKPVSCYDAPPIVQIDEGVAKLLLQEHQELTCISDSGPALSYATIR
uniref:Uncharacterized protein n=1 Tax=Amphimedon queenslandica TaxID=400682 RepID=A0A1X7U6F2_AMPQE